MPRNKVLTNPKAKMIWIESDLCEAASNRALDLGFNFSEYLARLLVADLTRKIGIAHRTPRRLKNAIKS